jgi:hypothetical protein
MPAVSDKVSLPTSTLELIIRSVVALVPISAGVYAGLNDHERFGWACFVCGLGVLGVQLPWKAGSG